MCMFCAYLNNHTANLGPLIFQYTNMMHREQEKQRLIEVQRLTFVPQTDYSGHDHTNNVKLV